MRTMTVAPFQFFVVMTFFNNTLQVITNQAPQMGLYLSRWLRGCPVTRYSYRSARETTVAAASGSSFGRYVTRVTYKTGAPGSTPSSRASNMVALRAVTVSFARAN